MKTYETGSNQMKGETARSYWEIFCPEKFSLKNDKILLASILLASFCFKLAYLFSISQYKQHLVSDMWGYWNRALTHYVGGVFLVNQWTAWPPLTHIVLSHLFKIISYFHLDHYRIEAVLIFFILLSVVSTYWVYKIALRVSFNKWLAIGSAGAYAFAYPLIYLNTFILSENLVIPLFVLAVFFLFLETSGKSVLLAAGVSLGIATALRPNMGVMILPFSIYLQMGQSYWKTKINRAFFLILGFLAVLFLAAVENNYLSQGQLRTFAPNGGYSFFIQQCKVHKIISNFPLYPSASAMHPSFSQNPELGEFITDHAWHDQNYFYKLGWECIQKNPFFWIDNLKMAKVLFFGPFFPSFPEIPGHLVLMKLYDYSTLFCSLILGLYCVRKGQDRPLSRENQLVLSIPVVNYLPFFFVNIEQRYFFPCLFAIYIAFFALLPDLKQIKKQALIYGLILGILFAGFRFWDHGHKQYLKQTFGAADVRIYPLDRMNEPKKRGIPWNAWGNLILIPPQRPVLLESKKEMEASELEISADCNDSYHLSFYRHEKHLGDLLVPIALIPGCGLETRNLLLPPLLKGEKFNRIVVRSHEHDNFCSIGHLQFRR